jgi:hypothetical protein
MYAVYADVCLLEPPPKLCIMRLVQSQSRKKTSKYLRYFIFLLVIMEYF